MATNLNECLLGGTIIEDPQIVGEGDGAWAFLKLMTTYAQRDADNKFTDQLQEVQLVADVPHHVRTATKYIKKGKAMTVSGYYRTWEANGVTHHGFFVRKFIFASANYGAEQGGQGGYTPNPPA